MLTEYQELALELITHGMTDTEGEVYLIGVQGPAGCGDWRFEFKASICWQSGGYSGWCLVTAQGPTKEAAVVGALLKRSDIVKTQIAAAAKLTSGGTSNGTD